MLIHRLFRLELRGSNRQDSRSSMSPWMIERLSGRQSERWLSVHILLPDCGVEQQWPPGGDLYALGLEYLAKILQQYADWLWSLPGPTPTPDEEDRAPVGV